MPGYTVRRGAIAQLGERLDRTQEVAGSSPASSIPVTDRTPRRQSCGGGVAVALAARGNRLAFRRRELDLPQADALRRHLDALIVPYELERLLERERAWRNEPDELVRGGGAHVRELFLLGG